MNSSSFAFAVENTLCPLGCQVLSGIRELGDLARWRAGVTAWLAITLLAGCTSMHPVARVDYAQLDAKIKPGDHVTCTLRDGTEVSFAVMQVEADALAGKKHRVALSDIVRLEVKRFSAGKTFWLVAGLVAAGLMVEGVASMSGLGIPAAAP